MTVKEGHGRRYQRPLSFATVDNIPMHKTMPCVTWVN